MKFLAEIVFLGLSSFLVHVFGQCQQACIPFSLVKDFKCSDILETRPFEVKQPGRCSKQNSEARNAICCSNSDAWVRNNANKPEQSLAISRAALEGEFPHQVYIQKTRGKSVNRCSGTVYTRNFIITSASCLFNNGTNTFDTTEKLSVIAGLTSPASSYSIQDSSYSVTEILPHPRFDASKIQDGYDIALLKLEKSLDFEAGNIRPLRIASKDFLPNYNEQGIVLDWNNKASRTAYPTMLKSFAPLRDPDMCQRIFGEDGMFYNILNHQLCVAGDSSGISVFEMDIGGGPAICSDQKNDNRPVLCGIASHKPCTSCKSPTVFTRISSFADWIQKTTKNEPQETQYFPDENIGGKTGEPEDFLVRIFAREKICDGALLSPNLIVTAKNCIIGTKNLESLIIIHSRTKGRLLQSEKQIDARYSSYYMEIGNINSTNVLRDNIRKYDLAFIRLEEPFRINFYPQISPDHYELKDAVEMSYSLKSNNLELRNFKLVEKGICQNRYDLLKVKLTAEMMCSAENYSGGSTCDRALGSPLICEGKYLCGIASSRGCSFAFPNIFTDTTELKEIITDAIEKSDGNS